MMEYFKKFVFCALLIIFAAVVFRIVLSKPIKVVIVQSVAITSPGSEQLDVFLGSPNNYLKVDAEVSTALHPLDINVENDILHPLYMKIDGQWAVPCGLF